MSITVSRTMLSRALPAIVVAVIAAAVALSSASAQAPAARTLTLKELEKGSTFTHVRNTKGAPKAANSRGDVIAFTTPLADSAGAKAGTLHASCTTTVGSRDFTKSTMTCIGVLALRDGSLTVQFNTSPGGSSTTGAVTGGTGAYANARGVLVSSASGDVITLAG